MQVSSFPLGLTATRATDLVLSDPARFMRSEHAAYGLQVMAHPLVNTRFLVSMMWHACVNLDPANQWLREQILATNTDASTNENSRPAR